MATRSFIATYNADTHEYIAIYCHWDGYPEGVGALLKNHYTDSVKIDQLMALGDLSVLGAEIGTQKDFDSRELNNECLAYGRDRGETGGEARTFRALYEVTDYFRGCGCEYGYIWRGDRWECLRLDPQEIDLYEMEDANV